MLGGKISKNTTLITLFVIFLIGLFLRLLYFDSITFGYDQARDAFSAIDIWKGDHIKLLGPGTDIKGVFHGPLYWYLISPFYFFSGGNPYFARLFLILLNLVNIFFIFYLAKIIFKNNLIALLSSFLFAISFESIQYARWMSNPAPSILTIALFFYGLWLLLEGKSTALPFIFFSWALSINFQFFLLYQIIFIVGSLIILLIKRNKISFNFGKAEILLYLLSMVFIAPFILSEIKFKFQTTKGLLGFILNKKQMSFNLLGKIDRFINGLIANVRFNLIDYDKILFPKIFFLILIVLVCYWSLKKKKYYQQVLFLSLWLVSPIFVYLMAGTNAYFETIGNAYPLILLISFFSVQLLLGRQTIIKKKIFISLILIFVFSNIILVVRNNKKGEFLFPVQKNMLLSDQKKVIDWIYEQSGKAHFAINTVTNPLFVNATWAYVLNWYGYDKYKYMPIWLGYPQANFPGYNVKFSDSGLKKDLLFFLIFEPTTGIPDTYVRAYSTFENKRSKLLEKNQIGDFVVDKRIITEDRAFSSDDLLYIINNNLYDQ